MKCEICRKEYKGLAGLSTHIGNTHKNEIKIKDYYDKYLKKEGESKCLECGKETKFSGFRGKYSKFCSPKCSNNNKEIKEKIKQIFLKKYGVLYPTQNKKIIEKREQLNKIKNIKNPNRVEKIKEKIKQTFLEKYGVQHQMQLEETKEKIKQTCLEKYGVENPFQNEDFKVIYQEKSRKTKINNGIYRSSYDKKILKDYTKLVRSLTRKAKKQLLKIWDGYDYYDDEYIKDNFSLNHNDNNYPNIDHKISIKYGFDNNIPIEDIANINNLCVTKKINNLSKGSNNDF